MKLLLVDDEPALRELLRATFEGADVRVDEASSGQEAEENVGSPDSVHWRCHQVERNGGPIRESHLRQARYPARSRPANGAEALRQTR